MSTSAKRMKRDLLHQIDSLEEQVYMALIEPTVDALSQIMMVSTKHVYITLFCKNVLEF
jgi:hypothetical protein